MRIELIPSQALRGLAAVWLTVVCVGSHAVAVAQTAEWITFERCPVMVEHSVQVPAQEGGILESLTVELNQTIEAGAVVGQLDKALAELELRAAKLEHALAVEVSRDNSNVEYHQIALQKVEQELASHQSISTSVSESEIRRLTLAVDQAKLALVRAEQAKKAAVGAAQLKQAAVDVAMLRLARRQVVSPLSGVVTQLNTHAGQAVEAGQTVLQVRNLENLIVDRLIPARQFDLSSLVGAEVRVDAPRSDGSSVRLSGVVASYDPEVSSAGLVRIHARVKNIKHGNDWVVLLGQEVTMHVAGKRTP